tara:strand:- start:6954 stop:8009 length:1056 start_codon:yes stop_codon:yes gene_type:complete
MNALDKFLSFLSPTFKSTMPESVEEQLQKQPGVGTEFELKTPKQVQQIGDLEKGLASLSRAIPRTNLGTVSTEGMLSDEQKKLIGKEEKPVPDIPTGGQEKKKIEPTPGQMIPDFSSRETTTKQEDTVAKPTKFQFNPSNTLTNFLTGAEGFIPTVSLSVESKLNPKLDKTYDIGYGHKLSSEEYKSGLVYGIKVKDDKGNFIPISKEDALKILNQDIKEKARITKGEYENQTGKKFSDLSKTIQELLVESTFNGLSPKKAPGLTTAASKNDIKGIVDNMTDRYTGPAGKRVILGDRNKRLWSSYLDKLSQNLSKQDYGQLKDKVLIERQPKKKQSGGIVRDPYKRQPRFI